MSEEKKPEEITGWVAWHPEKGVELLGMPVSKESAEDAAAEQLGFCWIFSYGGSRVVDQDLDEMQKAGWRIRPVKIVFTDEGGEK